MRHPKANETQRQQHLSKIDQYVNDGKTIVTVDESGFEENMWLHIRIFTPYCQTLAQQSQSSNKLNLGKEIVILIAQNDVNISFSGAIDCSGY